MLSPDSDQGLRQLSLRLYVLVNDSDAASRVLKRAAKAVGRPIEIGTIEQYWKDDALYVVNAVLTLESTAFAETVVESLQVVTKLTARWDVNAPTQYENGEWDFDGVASSGFSVSGIKFAEWSFLNPPR